MNRECLAGCIQSREFYESVSPYVSFSNQQDSGLFEIVQNYYHADDNADSVDLVFMQHMLSLGNRTQASKDSLMRYAADLSSTVIPSLNNVRQFVKAVREEDLQNRLAEQLVSPVKNRGLIDSLMAELQDLQTGQDSGNTILHGADILGLAKTYTEDGLLFGCPALQQRLGYGARPGHHIVVFARPDKGKTFFVLDCVASVAEQGKTVLVIVNEEPVQTTAVRLVCRLARVSLAYFARHPEEVNRLALANGYGNVILAELSPGHMGQVTSLTRRYQPTMVVLDQLRNMYAQSENNTQRLETLARAARNNGKIHKCITMSVVQAGDSAENKRLLTMGDVDGSNTGIQGACDMMIGVGCNVEDVAAGVRHGSINKAKIGGDSSPFLMHYNLNNSSVE